MRLSGNNQFPNSDIITAKAHCYPSGNEYRHGVRHFLSGRVKNGNLVPKEDQHMEVTGNGHGFHCVLEGPEGAPCVVLSHGLATDLAMWDPLVPHLVSHYRVLRYDARGHGRTQATAGDYTLEQLGGDAIAIVDALGLERPHFVGLSMGGMVGMGLALDHPGRFASVTVCDARGEAPQQYRDAWTERSRKVRESGIEAMVEPSVTRWFTERFQRDEPGKIAWMRDMIRRTTPDGYCGCASALRRLDYERRLGSIAIPMLFLVGEADKGAPPDAMRGMHEKTPGSRFATIAGAGHISVVEQPAAFAEALLGFLGEAERGNAGATHHAAD
jgi:3-oxoadipate enol-lactonase